MKSTKINCSKCKGTGQAVQGKAWSAENSCIPCNGYGYRHPPKGWLRRRALLSGEYYFFISAWDDDPKEEWNQRDYVELNGGGCLRVASAESYHPPHDRQKNFFFTIEEARAALSKIRKVINASK